VTAGEDCVVIGPEYFPIGLSVRVAGNTMYAQMQARAWRICSDSHRSVLITITIIVSISLEDS
jgi:hypothetical protein